MTVATNPAAALEALLRRYKRATTRGTGDRWASVLKAKYGTHKFVARHSEVVNLVVRVDAFVTSLPAKSRMRKIHYDWIPQWYDAVIGNQTGIPRVSDSALDALSTLGEVMSARSQDPVLTDDKLQALKSSLAEWRDLIEDDDLGVDLAQKIRGQVDLIEWLLQEVDTFGAEPVVDNARKLFGLTLPIVAKGGKWTKTAAGAMVGLVVFLGPVEDASGKVNGILKNLVETTKIVQQIGGEPQKALPAGQGDGKAIERGEEKRAIEGPQQGNGESPEG